MAQRTSARAEILLSGPDATYHPIAFTPVVNKHGHEIGLAELRIRRRDERYTLESVPLALALPQHVGKDIIYWTHEADGSEGDDRRESFELEMILPGNSDRFTLELRAVEHPSIPDMLFYEYRDETGLWQSIDDVLLRDVLPDPFVHALQSQILDSLRTNDLESLPGLLDD